MRKALLMLLTMLLTLPSFASAYNYWYVTKAASPSSLAASITAPVGAGYETAGSKTNITDAGITTADFTVVAPAGYSISSVKIDNVVATPVAADTYRVSKGTKTSHTIVAYYSAAKYLIDTTPAAGGFISPDAQVGGGDVTVQIIPNTGYSISSVIVDGSAVDAATLAQVQAAKAYTFTSVSASHTLTATFAVVPKVTAVIGTPAQTQPVSATVALDGSGSSSNVAATYTWSVLPAGPVLTPSADGKSATIKASAPADYTVTLTLSAAGATDSTANVAIKIVSDLEYTFQTCATCHNTRNPGLIEDFVTGAHGTASGHTTGTCQRCHATEGAIAGMTAGWTGSYQTLMDSQAAIWTPVQPAASNNGISCYACHDSKAGHFGALTAVKTNDGTNAVTWDPNQNGVTTDQYDLCTACHTLTDNTGAVVGNYHNGGSQSYERTITDTHFDKPTTGVGLASNVVEGYALRKTSANPCADCHNLHSANIEVQEAWAKSAHAGKIELKKEDAMCTDAAAFYGVADCTTIIPGTSPATNALSLYTSGAALIVNGTTVVVGDRNAVIASRENAGATDDADGNAWTHYNWDQVSGSGNRASCERCHTATGAANFMANPATYNSANNDYSHLSGWTAATGSPQNELLYCWGCHSNAQDGTLRNPGAITETYAAGTAGDPATTVSYPNVGPSNVCMACHLGRETGEVVKNNVDADGVRGFINSHYLAAGATVFNVSGYEFDGRTYEDGFHKNVGMGDIFGTGDAGPCVTCHMTSAEAHTFEVLDAAGAPATTVCAKCHTGLDAATLTASKDDFHAAMTALEEALLARGIEFKEAHPYFYIAGTSTAFTDWNSVAETLGVGLSTDPTGKGWKDVMGAAFNYNLFEHDPGAYAHNNGYVMQLIADSIDFLADGAINGQGTFDIAGTPTNLLGTTASYTNGVLAPATGVLASVAANEVSTNCGTCHTSTVGEWTDSRHGNANATPNCTSSCHNPSNELVFSESAGTVIRQIGCVGCHGTSSHPQSVYAAADSCVNCHNHTTDHHGDNNQKGKIEASKHAYLVHNTEERCARCHSLEGSIEFAAYTGDATVMNTLSTAEYDNGNHAPTCAACHDPHTTELRVVEGWEPSTNAQFNLCTSCHTYYNQDGMIVGGGSTTGAFANTSAPFYHATSWYRTIPATHYDNPATPSGTGGATNSPIEGYVIRTNGANPCFDCHGHELRTNSRYAGTPDPADVDKAPTIHTEWAQSAHAGGMLTAKLAAAAGTYANSNELTDAVMNAGATDAEIGNAWTHYNWDATFKADGVTKDRADCQHCHTATGAANYLDAAQAGTAYNVTGNDYSHLAGWNAAGGSAQQEVLYCWACHSSVDTGALRATSAFTVDYTVNGAGKSIASPDGKSTSCLTCHSGRGNLNTLLGAAALNPASTTVPSSPGTKTHYLAAGLTINQAELNLPYTFGQNYADPVYYAHKTIGCVDCHMAGANHSLDAVEKDAAGVVISINAQAKCDECHTVGGAYEMTAAKVEEEAEGFHQALEVFAEELVANGITPVAAYPYFTGTPATQGVAGAMYNYSFLHHEQGAFAHNRTLAKRMIFDSIDYLEDGVMNGTIADYSATHAEAALWLGTTRP